MCAERERAVRLSTSSCETRYKPNLTLEAFTAFRRVRGEAGRRRGISVARERGSRVEERRVCGGIGKVGGEGWSKVAARSGGPPSSWTGGKGPKCYLRKVEGEWV